MKKLVLVFIGLFLAFTLHSQGITTTSHYENGQVKEVLSFNEEEKLDGTCYAYNEDGTLIGVANYRDGVKHGEWKVWRNDGTLAYEMYYKKGEKVGKWKSYNEKGELIKERDFS